MPPEPKKPIEKLLEASAQTRRAEFGADPQMPNPMRARLQDEVAKCGREPTRPARGAWFGLTWPRLVMGTAFAALVAGAVAFWWQQEQRPASSPTFAASAPMAAAPAEDSRAEAEAESRILEVAKAAPAAAPAWQNFSQAAVAESAAGLTQNFAQAARGKVRSRVGELKKAPRVLDNFQVKQTGRDLRVVDADGSVYTGEIEPLAANAPQGPQGASSQEAGAAAQPTNEFRFRARGFNSRLQKPLTFEGDYIVGAAAAAAKDEKVVTDAVAPAPAARIIGQAVVAGEPPIAVDAVTVPAK